MSSSAMSKLNCEVLNDQLAFEVRWAVAGESIVLQLVAKLGDRDYMSFGLSGDDTRVEMIGGDVVVAWVDKNTLKGHALDYYLADKAQCSGPSGSCPDSKFDENTDNIRLLNAATVNGYSIVTYQRPLRASDQYDRPIYTNGSQAIIWAVGPLNQRNEVSFHSNYLKDNVFFDFARHPKWNCPQPEGETASPPPPQINHIQNRHQQVTEEPLEEPEQPPSTTRSRTNERRRGGNRGTSRPVAQSEDSENSATNSNSKRREESQPSRTRGGNRRGTTTSTIPPPAAVEKVKDAWVIPPIQCDEPEDGVFYAQMGPTGGKRGYPAITGHVGWGISWYINGLLIPEIHVVRGTTYTFVTEGGDNPEVPAKYHPFYITDDPIGGYEHKTAQEREGVQIFAGVRQAKDGSVHPTGTGRLCNWAQTGDMDADDFDSFGAYQRNLELRCDAGEPGVIQWTPDKDTPDTVYYQCFTHRYLGWKIHVHDHCDPQTAASELETTYIDAPAGGNLEHEDGELEGSPSQTVETRVNPNFIQNEDKNHIYTQTIQNNMNFDTVSQSTVSDLTTDPSSVVAQQSSVDVEPPFPVNQHSVEPLVDAQDPTGQFKEPYEPPQVYVEPFYQQNGQEYNQFSPAALAYTFRAPDMTDTETMTFGDESPSSTQDNLNNETISRPQQEPLIHIVDHKHQDSNYQHSQNQESLSYTFPQPQMQETTSTTQKPTKTNIINHDFKQTYIAQPLLVKTIKRKRPHNRPTQLMYVPVKNTLQRYHRIPSINQKPYFRRIPQKVVRHKTVPHHLENTQMVLKAPQAPKLVLTLPKPVKKTSPDSFLMPESLPKVQSTKISPPQISLMSETVKNVEVSPPQASTEKEPLENLPLAQNEGFKPETVIIESGFVPIVNPEVENRNDQESPHLEMKPESQIGVLNVEGEKFEKHEFKPIISTEKTTKIKRVKRPVKPQILKIVLKTRSLKDSDLEPIAEASEKVDSFYLPPPGQLVPRTSAKLPSNIDLEVEEGTPVKLAKSSPSKVFTSDGKQISAKSLSSDKLTTFDGKVVSSATLTAKIFDKSFLPERGTKASDFLRSRPQFVPFKGELPPLTPEVLFDPNKIQQKMGVLHRELDTPPLPSKSGITKLSRVRRNAHHTPEHTAEQMKGQTSSAMSVGSFLTPVNTILFCLGATYILNL